MIKHLLDVLQQVNIVSHDDEIAQIATGGAAHVTIFVVHQLTDGVGIRLDVLLDHGHLQRTENLIKYIFS